MPVYLRGSRAPSWIRPSPKITVAGFSRETQEELFACGSCTFRGRNFEPPRVPVYLVPEPPKRPHFTSVLEPDVDREIACEGGHVRSLARDFATSEDLWGRPCAVLEFQVDPAADFWRFSLRTFQPTDAARLKPPMLLLQGATPRLPCLCDPVSRGAQGPEWGHPVGSNGENA